MKKYLASLVLLIMAFSATIIAQSNSNETVIKDIDVNGKSYKGDYKIFLSNNEEIWSEVEIIDNKFCIPLYLRESEKLSIKFLLKKHQFVFSNTHISKFGQEWYVGIDDKYPFSEDYIPLKEQKNVIRHYYIKFGYTGVSVVESK